MTAPVLGLLTIVGKELVVAGFTQSGGHFAELIGACAAICEARTQGRPIVAVGTTVTRTLEGIAEAQGGLVPGRGQTSVFIRPGWRFRVVDQLLTNFHLPRSTLLMLVAAFLGRERTLEAYAEAGVTQLLIPFLRQGNKHLDSNLENIQPFIEVARSIG